MKFIKVKNVLNKENIIIVNYEISEELKKFFDMDNKFKVEYASDISEVPEEIAIIPFITNVIPIIWLTDSILEVEKVDKTFIESLDKVKKAFIEMYPEAVFKGEIKAKHLIKAKTCF